jgi:CO dehydrogenase/acetyl-CoA synthase alpha subunit|tara:strand:- start:2112 stop:2525 length:414 start_codon:yes stop_codon:yes gene_type:complete
MLDKIKSMFGQKKPEPKKKAAPKLSEKEKATRAGEPWVSILDMQLDPEDINNGAFEMDWNDKFVLNLIKAGYKEKDDDNDEEIVDRWFQQVCRNIALEVYEQAQADPHNRKDKDPITGADMRVVTSKDLGDGRTEVS